MFIENSAAFLGDFGETGLLDGVPVRVIFDAPYAEFPGGAAGMASAEPRVLIPSADVPPEASSDTADSLLELPEAATRRPGMPDRYTVTEVQPDGTGLFSTLILRKAA